MHWYVKYISDSFSLYCCCVCISWMSCGDLLEELYRKKYLDKLYSICIYSIVFGTVWIFSHPLILHRYENANDTYNILSRYLDEMWFLWQQRLGSLTWLTRDRFHINIYVIFTIVYVLHIILRMRKCIKAWNSKIKYVKE